MATPRLHATLLTLLAALLSAAAGAAPPEQGDQEPPVFRADVQMVLVDVIVEDDEGRFVHGLSADDFRVFEEGREVDVEFFAVERFRREITPELVTTVGEADPLEAATQTPLLPRYVVFFVDAFNTTPTDWRQVRDALLDWVETDLDDNDRILLAALTPDRRLLVAPQFTRDAEILADQIRQLRANPQIEARQRANESRLWELLYAQQEIDQTLGGGGAAGEVNRLRQGANLAGSFAGERTEEVLYTLDALTSLAAHLDRSFQLNGPKVMVLVSSGIPQHPGSVYYHIVNERFSEVDLEVRGEGGVEGLDPIAFRSQYAETVAQYLMRAVGRLNRLNYVLYSVSAQGALTNHRMGVEQGFRSNLSPGLQSIVARDSQDGLMMLARGTSGLAFYNSSDFDRFFERIDEDTAFRYVVGYLPPEHDPEDAEDGKFYRIEVETTVPGVEVRARRGYVDR